MTAADHVAWSFAYIERRYGPGPIYCPGDPYPSIWERIAAFGKRKNAPSKKAKPQAQKKRSKGGRRVKKDKGNSGAGGWF